MITEQLKQIKKQLEERNEIYIVEGTSEEKISEFEKENNIKLPEEYKEWLLISDGGEFFRPAGIQLYGIEHKPLIDLNNNTRPSKDYIVIGALSSGDPILCENNGNRIAIYNKEAGIIEDDEKYDGFIAFINDLL